MRKIKVSNTYAFVDDEDYEYLLLFNWYIRKCKHSTYASGYKKGFSTKKVNMHRIIMKALKGQEVDHINGNGLDNRKSNLRFCSRSQNNANRKIVQSKTSRFKGVHFDSYSKKWRADVYHNHIRYRLGRYKTQEEAAQAYITKAQELFGEFACIAQKSID